MRLSIRLRQVQHNLAENGPLTTLYKVYFYIYGHLYDRLAGGLNTTSPETVETLAEDGRPLGDRSAAFPCHPRVLRHALMKLKITPQDVFMDIGCGKGRALVEAHRFSFGRLVGVDMISSHISITRGNLQKLGVDPELILGDARTVTFPEDASICFLFKPFPEEVIQECVQRLGSNVRAVILMGTSDLKEIAGYRLTRDYTHRPCSRFNYCIFERESVPQRLEAQPSQPVIADA